MSHDLETFSIKEGTTPDYEATLLDKDLSEIPGGVLDSLTLTYYDEYTGEIINSRDGQNVLQINGVEVDSSGRLRWTLSQADSVILNDSLNEEPHIARFDYTYPGANGPEVARHEVRLLVDNVRKSP